MTPDDLVRETGMLDHPISLVRERASFDAMCAWLGGVGYRVEVLDGSSIEAFRLDMTCALKFRKLFGYEPWTGSLDALNDAARSIDPTESRGLALCITRVDRLFAFDRTHLEGTFDVLTHASRQHASLGT